MKKALLLLAILCSCLRQMQAANSDWYLYIWSDTNNSGSDVGQFQTTSQDGVFILEGVTTTESGLKFCIHNSAWSTKYGWSTGSEGSVSYTGTDVALGIASSASGWIGLPAGTYDVTFNVNGPSVRFDASLPAVGTGTTKVSILGDSYSTFYGYLTPSTNASWYSSVTPDWYSDNDVSTVEQTWWYKFITGGDYVLERNNSYSGATMVNGCLSDMDVSTSFISRATDLGSPDIIFVFGGTNDWWNNNSFSLGDYIYSGWTDDQKVQFRPGFAYLLNLLKTTYSEASIYFILNDMITDTAGGNSSSSNVRTSIKTICEHYSVPVIELSDIAKGSYHPTAAGMTDIAWQVQDYLDEEAGIGAESNWYISGDFNNWARGTKFNRSTTNNDVLTIDDFVLTSDQINEWGGVSFCITTPDPEQTYVCNSNISTLDTEYDFVLQATEGAWSSAYCTVIKANKSYELTWNRRTHKLSINEKPLSFQIYEDGHAVVVANDYLRGGDISMLNYVESFGAKFYDANGTQKDALDIMQENGVNIVRLRLYNNPGEEISYVGDDNNTYTYKMPASFLDEDDVLSLARRAKAHNMKIQLTFHYSDFWTNGSMQFKPREWKNLTLDQLKTAIYDYTKAFLQRMNAQGTTPEYVSLGNEIESGFLFGYYMDMDAVRGAWDKPANEAALLGEASKAVREVCPAAKIIIHYTLSQNVGWTRYKTLLTNLKNNGYNDYDIVGASYYPYWTEQLPSMLTTLANNVYSNFGKDLMIMETGYSWTQYRPSGRNGGNYEGQLHMNGDIYNEATEAGQKSFMQELQAVVKGNEHILGYLYWDPLMVDQKVEGKWIETTWAMKKSDNKWWQDGNVVSNTTWFDYDGKALPVFEAIAEDAFSIPSTVIVNGTVYTVEQQPPFELTIGNTGYATFYDSEARQLPEGLTAYIVENVSDSHIQLTDIAPQNIPAETGVLLHGEEGTYYLWSRPGDGSAVMGNMLYGTVTEQTITTPIGNYYYYKLANDSTKGLGWYWDAENGSPFTNAAHKAYLVVPIGAGIKSFIPLFDDETGLEEMVNGQWSMVNGLNGKCYDLSGRKIVNCKLSNCQIPRGIYIINGEKVVK